MQSMMRELRRTVVQYREEMQRLKEDIQRLKNIEWARSIAQEVGLAIEQKVHNQISVVVTDCIQNVFGPDYSFMILFERKRGRTEAKPILRFKDHEIEDPLNEDSGGVCDVAAFALRLSCMVLIKPPLQRTLILDEPFKNVHSEEYRSNIRHMLNQLAKQFKVQFIMVTGTTDFITGIEVKL